ncbi:MAG TPA: hypothetical protein VM425_20025 [Myxococcota bacterium]|nr:hypothetical protein [Myxococcota bacterium]
MSEHRHFSDEVLSAYIDQDLDRERSAEIADQLGSCAACRAVVAEIEAIKNDLTDLGQAQPQRDLWPAIRRDMARARETVSWWRRFWMVPVAAAVGAAAAVLLVLVFTGPARQGSVKPAGKLDALASVQKAELEYRGAIASLQQALRSDKPAWGPRTQQVIEDSLAEIDKSIRRCHQAIRAEPENIQAHEMVLAAYQQKVDLLTELVAESM